MSPHRVVTPPVHLLVALGSLLTLVGCAAHPLADPRDEVAYAAIATYTEAGREALPELFELAESNDLLLRARAKRAIGQITGQWGAREDGIVWERSVEAAVGRDRPILVLHLFGNFDEEFC